MKPNTLFHKNFILVVIGQIISLFGNGIIRFALPLFLFDQTGSAALLGIVSACSFLPMIILSPIGGIIADRVNKQKIMVILDFSTAALIIILFILLGKVSILPLFICILMVLYGIQGAYQPAVQASIPLLADESKLLTANAVINQVSSLSGLLSPVLGGFLYGTYGLTPILFIGTICFFLSAVMELFIRIPFFKQKYSASVFDMVKEDIKVSTDFIFRKNPILVKVIGLICCFNLVMSSMLIIGLQVIIKQTLGMSSELYGISQGALALGGLLGGITAGILGQKLDIKKSHLLLLACSIGILPMGFGLMLGINHFICYIIITVMSCFLMVVSTIFTIQIMAFVQTQTPTELLGKVISFLLALSMCAQPIGQTIYGLLFEKFASMTWVVVLGSAVCSIFIAIYSKQTLGKLGENELTTEAAKK